MRGNLTMEEIMAIVTLNERADFGSATSIDRSYSGKSSIDANLPRFYSD